LPRVFTVFGTLKSGCRPEVYPMATTRDPHEEAKMTVSAESRVVASTGEGLRTEVEAGGHAVIADEPESLGGTDEGPTPYDYLLAALGGCTAMTLRMYADRKGWPLESVTVCLSQDRIHATDCEECETEEGRIDRIEREIELEGPLEEEQRRRLLEVADMCPVHRTLETEVLVENSLVG
jgi:uncharacterized OsmC-like protein